MGKVEQILAGLMLACAPALAHAEAAPDAPVNVSVKADTTAPAGAVRTDTQVVVQPHFAPRVEARIAVSFAAGQRGDATPPWAGVSSLQPFAWNRAGVAVQAAWTATSGARVQVDASDELRTQSFIGPATATTRPISQDEAQGATLKATTQLTSGLDLTLAAGLGADDGAIDLVQGGSNVRRVAMRDERGDLASRLVWTYHKLVSVEVGEKVESRSLSWGYGGVVDDFAAVEPRLAAVVKPKSDLEASVTIEESMSPLQTAKFAALAQAAETAGQPAAGGRLRPDEAWQLKAALTRRFAKTGQLTVAYTHADLKSSTELVQIAPGVQAPGSVTGGQRRQWDMSLNLPLRLIGLDALAVQGSGVMRWSEIPDPITGLQRPPSGETPYEAKLGLTADLPASRLRLGLQSQASGPQTIYGMARIDQMSVSPSVGAFIEFRPADLSLRLQLNDLAGADRRYVSTIYGQSRDLPPTLETDRRVAGATGFTLSLKKSL